MFSGVLYLHILHVSLLLVKIWFNMAIHGGVRREMAAVPKLNLTGRITLRNVGF